MASVSESECVALLSQQTTQMKNGKRSALSDLTNSSHFSSSSVSSSATIEPIKKNQINIRKTCLTPLDVNPSTVHRTKNQINTEPLPSALTVRCKKKQRIVSNEQEELEDYIEKQKAYFKQIDEYELEEEEVEEYIDE